MMSRNFFLCIALVFFQTFGLLTAIHPPSYGSRTRIWRHRQGKPTLEMNSGIGVRTDTRHPLDPLTEVEINASSNIILNYKRGNWIFISISLKEPEKSVLLPYFLNDTTPPRTSVIPRRSFTILLDGVANQAHEVTVNLNTRRVEVWDLAPLGASPSFTPEEQEESMKIARENATVLERCRRLGWANMSLVYPDPT
ncbi:unnamed protein product [Orchesella dallaii]|uniref:Amine oxidase n=1 Tax=Orchesella dallaii TaxID=48710 RepID=A0ABP1RB69_9HEXA